MYEGKHAGARERRRPAHKVADSVDRCLDRSVNERSSAPAIVDGREPELRPHEGSLECWHLQRERRPARACGVLRVLGSFSQLFRSWKFEKASTLGLIANPGTRCSAKRQVAPRPNLAGAKGASSRSPAATSPLGSPLLMSIICGSEILPILGAGILPNWVSNPSARRARLHSGTRPQHQRSPPGLRIAPRVCTAGWRASWRAR